MRREEFYRKLPYVTELRGEHDTPCDGIKYSKVALRDRFSMYGKPARGIQPRARCKNRARWKFTATRRLRRGDWAPATSGNYCTIHLSKMIVAFAPTGTVGSTCAPPTTATPVSMNCRRWS